MKIYLAGKWEEYQTIQAYANLLRAAGHVITCPWFEAHIGPSIDLKQGAIDDEQGVRDAELCIFIFERNLPYSGAMTELGLALALRKQIVVVGTGGNRNIFTHHPAVTKISSFEEIKDYVR